MCVQNIETPFEKIKEQIESSTHCSMDEFFLSMMLPN